MNTIMNQLGRQIPLKTARSAGWFVLMAQDGTVSATLDLAAYLQQAAPVLPDKVDWFTKAAATIGRMYDNDTYGCCVISSLYHELGLWTANESGTAVLATDAEVLATYRIWNPGRQDNGCDIQTVLNYNRDHGVIAGGKLYKIDSYVSVDNTNWDLCCAATDLFGSLKLGIDLPQAWYDAPNNGTWDVTSTRIIGGHDVPTGRFDRTANTMDIATWAGTRSITKAAFTGKQHITECYAVLSPDWDSTGTAPNGIDVTTLKADLALVAAGQIPSVGPPVVPMDWLI